MSRLKISLDCQKQIDRVIDNATNNVLSWDMMMETIQGEREAVGYNDDFCCYILGNHRVVYSIEEQPMGACRHISISESDDGLKLPKDYMLDVILKAFGFKHRTQVETKGSMFYIEEEIVYNVVELF